MFKHTTFISCLFLCFHLSSTAYALTYDLHVFVDVEHKKIDALAQIGEHKSSLLLDLSGLTQVVVDGKALPENQTQIAVTPPVTIQYQRNIKTPEHFILLDDWYPQPESLAVYSLSVDVPKGFLALSEADDIKTQGQSIQFSYAKPLDSLSLIVSNQYEVQQKTYKDITISSYLLKDNAHLAAQYIDKSIDYIQYHEQQLTPYPHKRFSIVENPAPTGYALPTYTLLGSHVLRLPFILDTSLGHEIVHQWLGNYVYIDNSQGNWAEGLTTYLADHSYTDSKTYRHKILNDYAAYVQQPMAIKDFRYRQNKAQSSVGYGKVAMLFHQLKRRYGQKTFQQALAHFIENNQGKKATWTNIQSSFEQVTKTDLSAFFDYWLHTTSIADIQASKPKLSLKQGQIHFQFELKQANEPFQPLEIPITFYTDVNKIHKTLKLDQAQQTFDIVLPTRPYKVVLDADYDLMRVLSPEEKPASLNRILADSDVLIVMAAKHKTIYAPLLVGLNQAQSQIVEPAQLTLEQLKNQSVILVGNDNPRLNDLFPSHQTAQGTDLSLYKNPYNPNKVVLLLHADNQQQAQASARKLRHYGKYTRLNFNNGKLISKQQDKPQQGLLVFEQTKNAVVQPAQTKTLYQVLETVKDKKFIYVGEQHDQFAHHLNQLAVIQYLQQNGHKIAVGMEMFQHPAQTAIDAYFADDISEREFLQQSGYFAKWRYDYNLYKPIIDYLKQQKIPLIALNIEGDINRKIARQGMDALTEQEKQQLPRQLDFSNQQYQQDLAKVFNQHAMMGANRPFAYFLQAQTVWDETMAQTAVDYVKQQPDTQMVILAGNGHFRFKYGISGRVQRQYPSSDSVILQDEDLDKSIADHVIFTQTMTAQAAPKLGVYLLEKENELHVEQVSQPSLAATVGIQKGDVLLKFDQHKLQSISDLKLALHYYQQQTSHLSVRRDGKILSKKLSLQAHHP